MASCGFLQLDYFVLHVVAEVVAAIIDQNRSLIITSSH